MRIETPTGMYRVIQVLREDLEMFSCLAFREGTKRETRFLIQEFCEPSVAKRLLCCLMNPQGEEIPGVEVVVNGGNLQVISRYYSGMPFLETAARTVCQEEKLALWDGALREIFFRRLPVYMQYEALHHLVVDDGGVVHANGLLADVQKAGENLFPEIQRVLSELFLSLFECGERKQDSAAAAYRERLRMADFADGVSVYRGFRALRQAL